MAIWIDRPMAPQVTLDSLTARAGASAANVQVARSILAQLEVDGLERWIGSVGIERLRAQGQFDLGGVAEAGAIASRILKDLTVDTGFGDVALPVGAVRVLQATTFPRATVVGKDGRVEAKEASADRTLLALRVGVLLPADLVAAEDFAVQVGEETFPAFALAPAPIQLAREPSPTFDASKAAAPAGPLARLRPKRWQVGFEIPQQANQGTLVWRNALGVDWSLDR
jgi:hypothetical protein